MEMLIQQYSMVKNTRETLFAFFETMNEELLLQAVDAFNGKSICTLQTHVTNVYIHWIALFAMQKNIPYFDEATVKTVHHLRQNFTVVDELMNHFIQQNELAKCAITGRFTGDKESKTFSGLQIFTHVITHEFHHKGQLLSMARLLGLVPVDTDVIRF